MKRFLSSVALCAALLFIGSYLFSPATEAQGNTLALLLELPAPPPPNPFYRPDLTERNEDFFDKKTPPADNASIDDLLAYWKHQNQFDAKYTYVPKPSPKTLARLMDEVEKKPELLSELLDAFPKAPETAELVKRLYDKELDDPKFDSSWRAEVKKWLTYNTNFFSNELYQIANQAGDTNEYVTNQNEVLALARVDWEKAKPLLDRLLADSNQPVSQTLARWAYYRHALETNDTFDIEKYRRELQDAVENKSAGAGMRDLAMDALVESGDFPGRDDWYYSLLEDETLYELRVNGTVYTGLTTIINHSPDDKYVAKMVELAASSNLTIRSAAVRNLSVLLDDNIAKKDPSIIRALLPWLENPKWAREANGERTKIVAALRLFVIPESVPGLIAMLNEKEVEEVSVSQSNTNTVVRPTTGNSNTARRMQTVETYPYRSSAIMALATQKSPQAASALRQVLPFVESWERSGTVRAILVSNGFTITEQIDALEEAAKNLDEQQRSSMSNVNAAYNTSSSFTIDEEETLTAPMVKTTNTATTNTRFSPQPFNAGDLRAELGSQLVALEEPSEELVKAVISRIEFQEKKNPALATALRLIIQNWKGTAINALLLRDLRDGKSNLQAIVKLLTLRKELREKQSSDVSDIRTGNQTALGISACLLEQPAEYDALLDGGSDEAKIALLACARLIRAALPVPKAAAHLKSQNKLLVLAAERYLESEDSPEARRIVLERHPNEARILGARTAFTAGNDNESGFSPMMAPLFASVDSLFEKFPAYYFYSFSEDDTLEKKLQAEVKGNQELFGIYSYDDNFVRIYADKAVYSWQDDPARYRERVLRADEFDALKNFFVSQRVDELPPFLSPCEGCASKELLMLGKAGGRRVYVKADPLPQFFVELEAMFEEFRRAPAQIHYYFGKSVAGVEVLFAADDKSATAVWKNGADFRLLIDDVAVRKQNEKTSEISENNAVIDGEDELEEPPTPDQKAELVRIRREYLQKARQKAYGSYTWYKFDKTRLLEPVVQPALIEFIPALDGFAVQPGEQQWKARAGGVEVRADEEGLYRIKGGQMTRIASGYFYKPLVTPNGRWAIATKFSRGEDGVDDSVVRINLLTGKEFKVNAESDYGVPQSAAYLAPLNKVLLFSSYGDSETLSERSGQLFLLDPETGAVQPFKGEAQPLLQQTFRPLQPVAASPELFWAALPDAEKTVTQFGIYNARTLSFKSLLTIPQILFDSMNMWIDEGEGKIYLVYEGHLLALPLPKNR